MSIAVRERRQEIAVLKTLGFSSGLVMTLIISEALLLGVMGGLLGILLSREHDLCPGNALSLATCCVPSRTLGCRHRSLPSGLGIALLLGLLAGFIPALLAYRARITEALRQV